MSDTQHTWFVLERHHWTRDVDGHPTRTSIGATYRELKLDVDTWLVSEGVGGVGYTVKFDEQRGDDGRVTSVSAELYLPAASGDAWPPHSEHMTISAGRQVGMALTSLDSEPIAPREQISELACGCTQVTLPPIADQQIELFNDSTSPVEIEITTASGVPVRVDVESAREDTAL